MNQLPSELFEAIIHFSLAPAVPAVEFRERYDALMTYSLVAPRWRTVAQNEMLRHLWVQDAEAEKRLDHSPLKRYLENRQVQSVAFGYGERVYGRLHEGRFMEHFMLRIKHNIPRAILWNLGIDRFDFYALQGKGTPSIHAR